MFCYNICKMWVGPWSPWFHPPPVSDTWFHPPPVSHTITAEIFYFLHAAQDTTDLFGQYQMTNDYPPPIIGRVDQINHLPINDLNRIVCYSQNTYTDDIAEGNEVFGIRLIIQDTTDPKTMLDGMFSTVIVTIVDDGEFATYMHTQVIMFSVNITDSEVNCPSLRNPDKGMLTVTDNTATYTCDPDYGLRGTAERECDLSTGIWGGDAPVCLRKLVLTFVPSMRTMTRFLLYFYHAYVSSCYCTLADTSILHCLCHG